MTLFRVLSSNRYENNLTQGRSVGIKKGVMLGLTQGLTNIVLFGGISIIFWYGPYLIRHECENYSAGHWMVVRISLSAILVFRQNESNSCLDIHHLFNVHILFG